MPARCHLVQLVAPWIAVVALLTAAHASPFAAKTNHSFPAGSGICTGADGV